MEKSGDKLRRALESCPAYPILDSTTLEIHPMDRWLETLAGAGVRIVQLRLKDAPDSRLAETGGEFVALCRSLDVISIINDRTDVALSLGADGVHLGMHDELVTDARIEAFRHPNGGAKFIVGGSARTQERARTLASAGATYLGCGACYPTATKPDAEYIGLKRFAEVAACVDIPVVGIGGIDWSNFREVLGAGAAGFAAISMFQEELKDVFNGTRAI